MDGTGLADSAAESFAARRPSERHMLESFPRHGSQHRLLGESEYLHVPKGA